MQFLALLLITLMAAGQAGEDPVMCESVSADHPLVLNTVYSSRTKTNGLEVSAGTTDGGAITVKCSGRKGAPQCIISAEGDFIVRARLEDLDATYFKASGQIKIISKDGTLVCEPVAEDEGLRK